MIGAKDLRDLLEVRHSKDVFEKEIRTPCGRRIDALAVRRSWAQANVLGYEIKVSRRDFLADIKWRDYLPYCNEFYFVTSPGVCHAMELPAEAGLIVCSTNARRLYTKKKAPQREADLQEMFRAILICRHGQDAFDYSRQQLQGVDYWREWLGRRKEDQEIGHRVGERLRELYRENVERVETRQYALENEIEDLGDVRNMLVDMDISPSDWNIPGRVHTKLAGEYPPEVVHAINRIAREVDLLQEKLAERGR